MEEISEDTLGEGKMNLRPPSSELSSGPPGEQSRRGYPKSLPYIVLNECCERFSYYGLRAILALYMKNSLGFKEDTATAVFHTFVFAAYFMPLFGGILADSYWGKYKTILRISLIYCAGGGLLSITAIRAVNHGHWWGLAISLLLISVGTGGIKPCVSAFLGDQFGTGQQKQFDNVFFIFYFAINLGSLLSTFITPLLRESVSYWAAFGLPALLLLIATTIFWIGRRQYKHTMIGGNPIALVWRVCSVAWKKRKRRGGRPAARSSSWLDGAVPDYGSDTVSDVKRVLQVLKVFLPLPIFWCLFDQQSSRFIFQAEDMNRDIGSVTLLPDQIPSLNPLFVLILIPVFNRWIYPGLESVGLRLRYLTRMAIGMVITSLSYAAAGCVQLAINEQGTGEVHVAWQMGQYFLLTAGEIMISITGLEFAYSQAPSSMKSVVMACFLLTTAIGNIIVVIVAGSSAMPQSVEFFFFAALMLIVMVAFAYLTRHYVYVEREDKVVEMQNMAVVTPVWGDGMDLPPDDGISTEHEKMLYVFDHKDGI